MYGTTLLGELLRDLGAITDEQLGAALLEQMRSGRMIGAILVSAGACDDEAVAKAIALQTNARYAQFAKFDLSPDVIELVPPQVASRHRIIPLKLGRRALLVATASRPNFVALDDLRSQLGHEIEYVIASDSGIRGALERYYGIREDASDLPTEAPIEIVVAETPVEAVAVSDEGPTELGGAAGCFARDGATGGLDERLRRALGEAESDGTGTAWARAAVALARAGLFTRAEQAHSRAIAEGFATAEIDHVLEWGSLGEISARELGVRHERCETLGSLVFDPFRRVVLARRADKLDELDALTGAIRELPLPPLEGPIAIDPRDGRIACVFANPPVLTIYDVAKGTVGRRLRLEERITELAFLPGGFIVFGTTAGLHAIRKDALGYHRPHQVISEPNDGGGFVVGRSAIYSWQTSGEIFQHAAPRFERRPFAVASPCPSILEPVPCRRSPEAKRLIAAGEACALVARTWDGKGRLAGERLRTFTADGRVRRPSLIEGLPSPSGRYIALNLDDMLEIVDSETGDLATFRFGRPIGQMAWSPAGRELAVALAATGTVLLVGPQRQGERDGSPTGPWLTIKNRRPDVRARAIGCGVEYERGDEKGVVVCASIEEARERAAEVLADVARRRSSPRDFMIH